MGVRQLVAKDHRLPFCGPCTCGPALFGANSSGVSLEAGGCAGTPTREPGAAWAGGGSLEAGSAHRGGGGRQALCLAVLGGRWPRAPCPSTAPPGGLGQHWSPGVLWMSPESASPTGPAAWGGDFPAKIHDWHRELIQRWLKIKGSIILVKFHLF